MDIPYYVQQQFASFTPLERQSFYQMMCSMMIVDNDIDPREVKVINEISQAMGLTQRDIEASRNLSKDTMTSTLKRMPEEKRFLLARTISTIAMADGKVTGREDAFAAYLAKELNLDKDWF